MNGAENDLLIQPLERHLLEGTDAAHKKVMLAETLDVEIGWDAFLHDAPLVCTVGSGGLEGRDGPISGIHSSRTSSNVMQTGLRPDTKRPPHTRPLVSATVPERAARGVPSASERTSPTTARTSIAG